MSSYNLYDGSVAYFISGLKVLAHVLKKAEEHAKAKNIPESEFMTASLAPDMKPLTFQVQTASNTSKNTLVRLLSATPQPMDDNENSFAELQKRIAKTLEILTKVKPEEFEIDTTQEIKVPFGGSEMPFTKKGYVLGFAVPNFYFHVVTAYAILRSKGVEIGKADFIRPGMM